MNAENLAVKEEQGSERLILSRGRDVSAGRQGIEEGGDVLGAESGRITAAVELVVAAHPAEIGLLGARAEVTQVHGLARAR